ncbi:MAG: hypothetical protein PVJ42_09125 [bacterium]|jgi:hypothetical protein
MTDQDGMQPQDAPQAPGRRPIPTIGIIAVLVVVVLIFFGPRLLRKFEEYPPADVCDILRGDVEGDLVMVRGIVQRERSGQGYIFLGDVEEHGEILVDGIRMMPVIRVQSWAWFNTGDEVRLPVRITRDSDGNLLLVEARERRERSHRGMVERGGADSAGATREAQDGR